MPQALAGLRILDLTQVYSGPYATRLLAALGAEVVRVEAPMRPGRGPSPPIPAGLGILYPGGEPGERPYNRFAYYNELNPGKLAMALDLSTGEGRAIFKRLVMVSDVVMENFSPRVMPHFGLDYPALRCLRPDLIMVSLPAFGLTGPYRDYVAYGTGLEGMVGLSSMTGYPDGPPLKPGIAYGDPIGGLHAAFAVLAALRFRRHTGQGQHIDLSLRESLTMVVGEAIMDYSMNRRVTRRQGNRHPAWTPHGVYPCQGHDQWIAIAVRSDGEWQALCREMGSPEWAQDTTLATAPGRRQRWEELDQRLAEWTRHFGHYELMHRLQRAGLPAAVVATSAELVADPHFQERGFFLQLHHAEAGTQPPPVVSTPETDDAGGMEHPAAGAHLYPGVPWSMGLTPGALRRPPPNFGEHNRWALEALLGLPPAEVASLLAAGVVAAQPTR